MTTVSPPTPPRPMRPSRLLGRSLLPLAALLLLASCLLWGPFGFALATLCWWQVVSRIA